MNLKSRNSKSGFESSFLGCTEWVLQLDITKKKCHRHVGDFINNPYTNISIVEQESFKHFFLQIETYRKQKHLFFQRGEGLCRYKFNILMKDL